MRKLLRRPSPAMIVACLALLVALGGTSVAAVSQLARNSVGTPQLRNSAVTNVKVSNNAINSAKVRPRSLLRSDFAAGQLPAGPVGPQGPAGPAGAAGPAGPAGAISAVTVRTNFVNVPAGGAAYNSARVTRTCEGNERAISAGTSWGDDGADLELSTGEVEPQLNAQNQVVGFVAVGVNGSPDASNFSIHVLCYTP
jgi:hypothetical protein